MRRVFQLVPFLEPGDAIGNHARRFAAILGAAHAGYIVERASGEPARTAIPFMRAEIDPEDQGGAYLLGLRQLGVVAHGRFTRRGFARAVEVAARGVQEDVISRTRAALEHAGALRPPRSPSEPAATVSGR